MNAGTVEKPSVGSRLSLNIREVIQEIKPIKILESERMSLFVIPHYVSLHPGE